MNRDGMHPFLKFVLVLVALVVLGPPALGVLAGLIGLAIGLTAIALKLGAVALAVFALVAVFRALFSTPSRQGQPTPIEVSHEDALRRDDELRIAEAPRIVPDEAIGEAERTLLLVEREHDAVGRPVCQEQVLQPHAFSILVPDGRPADGAAPCRPGHRSSRSGG